MKRKDDFHFDFNEDAEPVAELHRMRAAMAKRFKTTQALCEYFRSTPSLKELIAELQSEIDEEKANPAQSRKGAPKKKVPARRKHPAHA